MLFDRGKTKEADQLYSASNDAGTKRAEAWLTSRLAKTKAAKQMEFETVKISPGLAELMLKRNTHNRALSRNNVNKHINTILDGRWQLTPHGIAFDKNGALLDGQHRLQAIVDTATTLPMVVVFGADPETFKVIDTGKVRTAGNVCDIAGVQNYAAVAAAARVFNIVQSSTPLGNQTFAPELILQTIKDHPDLERAGVDGLRVYRHVRAHSTAPIIAALAIICEQSSYEDRYKQFVDGLADGEGLRKGSPIYTLREGLNGRKFLGDDSTGRGNTARRNACVCAAIILAWNRYVANRSAAASALKWNGATEFPEPI